MPEFHNKSPFLSLRKVYLTCLCVYLGVHLEDEKDEEEHQDDLNADDKQLREEVGQHRLHGAHA